MAAQTCGCGTSNCVTPALMDEYMYRLRARFCDWLFRRVASPVFRRFCPVVVFSPATQRVLLRLARAAHLYPHEIPSQIPPIAFIWRHADVCEVLADYEHFSVEGYDERMAHCGNRFLLGYDFESEEYLRDIKLWRGAVKPEDRDRVRNIAKRHSQHAVESAKRKGQIDVVQDLVGPVVAGFIGDYLGVPDLWSVRADNLSFKEFLDTATYMFGLEILNGPTAEPARASGNRIKAHLERLIEERRHVLTTPSDAPAETMLDRLLRTEKSDDLVRRIVGGTASGSIAVTFSQCLWVIDRLMDLPPIKLAELLQIAKEGDDALLDRYVREASRFKPFPPGLLRRCKGERQLGRSAWCKPTLPDGTLVVALTWSAAFDKEVVPNPGEFHVGRDDREYLLFGTGQHACPAAQLDRPIAQTLMGEMVKALFALPGLRRAPGGSGFIQPDRSPGGWPKHFMLRFDVLPQEPVAAGHGSSNESLVLSYLGLRKAIGVIGIALPFVLALGKVLFFSPGLEDSISDYYYTGMRNVFVGSLCAIGVFLLSYHGYELRDDIAGDLAGLSAIGFALCPTMPTAPGIVVTSHERILSILHMVFVTGFLLTLAYFSLVLFRKTDPNKRPTLRKLQRNRVYTACGYAILACLALIAMAKLVLQPLCPTMGHLVFWLESAAVVAFGLSWFTKGEAILRDLEVP